MAKSRLSNSFRKYLRKEKARLRRESLDQAAAEAKIKELVARVFAEYNRDTGRNKSDPNNPNAPE